MIRPSRSAIAVLFGVGLAIGVTQHANAATVRIKDIVEFEGVRENFLLGYGLVVGLAGTGDPLWNAPMTAQSLEAMLGRLGVNTRDARLNTKNVAAVIVTAKLPPFATAGSEIDATVSAAGSAKSLLGGTLLITPLLGADGQTYAVAQGSVQTGAISARGASGSSVSKGVATAGRIVGGAIVERETGYQLNAMPQVRVTLRNPDFTTAVRVAQAVNRRFPGTAQAQNPTVVLLRPLAGQSVSQMLTAVEQLPIETDAPARVVIDEVSGVIVMGAEVRISSVAISQGNLTISVQEQPQVSQPTPYSNGQTAVLAQSSVSISEEKGKGLVYLTAGSTFSSLVAGLNALGVTPRDMISILQAIRAAGALQGDIEVL